MFIRGHDSHGYFGQMYIFNLFCSSVLNRQYLRSLPAPLFLDRVHCCTSMSVIANGLLMLHLQLLRINDTLHFLFLVLLTFKLIFVLISMCLVFVYVIKMLHFLLLSLVVNILLLYIHPSFNGQVMKFGNENQIDLIAADVGGAVAAAPHEAQIELFNALIDGCSEAAEHGNLDLKVCMTFLLNLVWKWLIDSI